VVSSVFLLACAKYFAWLTVYVGPQSSPATVCCENSIHSACQTSNVLLPSFAGVGMGGVLELKAELYRAQEEARLNPQVRGRKRGRIGIKNEVKNAGVETRDMRDRAAIKVRGGLW
jgi:hypothetical protein